MNILKYPKMQKIDRILPFQMYLHKAPAERAAKLFYPSFTVKFSGTVWEQSFFTWLLKYDF